MSEDGKGMRAWAVRLLLLSPALILLAVGLKDMVIEDGATAKTWVAVALAAALLLAQLLSRPWRENLSLALVSTYVAAFAVNLLLDFRYWETRRQAIYDDLSKLFQTLELQERRRMKAAEIGLPFDGRLPFEILPDLEADGRNGVQRVCPTHSTAFEPSNGVYPLSAQPMQNVVYCNEAGYPGTFLSDRYGFANPDQIYDMIARDEPSPRVLVLGDSFAQGTCVRAGSDVGGWLRGKGYRAANLSCVGNGVVSSLAIWQEYGRHVPADYALFFFYGGNDLSNFRWERDAFMSAYLDPTYSQDLIHRSEAVAESRAELIQVLNELRAEKLEWHEKLSGPEGEEIVEARLQELREQDRRTDNTTWRRLVTLAHVRGLLGLLEIVDDSWKNGERLQGYLPLFQRAMTEMRDRVTGTGAQLVFVYLPSYKAVQREGRIADVKVYDEDFRPEILGIVEKLGIPVIDFQPALLSQPNPDLFFPLGMEGHYNADGYRLLSDVVHEELRELRDE